MSIRDKGILFTRVFTIDFMQLGCSMHEGRKSDMVKGSGYACDGDDGKSWKLMDSIKVMEPLSAVNKCLGR